MSEPFAYDVFLSHSTKDKLVVRPVAERLRKDGLKVWFDEWVLKPGDSIPAKIEEWLECSRVLVLCMSANAFGSDWAQLEAGTFRFRDPLNKERRFIPLRLDPAPIKGSLAQFLYINWRPVDREEEYAKLLEACRPALKPDLSINQENPSETVRHVARLVHARLKEWKRIQEDFEAEARKYHDVKVSIFIVTENGPPAANKFTTPNYSVNLWQIFGATGCEKTMERLRSAKLTDFGMSGAEVTAFGVIVGEQTDFFRKMALRAGTMLPDEVGHIVAGNAARIFKHELGPGKPIVTSNGNPLAKWINMMLVATTSSHPERFRDGKLVVDPFAASLSVFDFFAIQLPAESSAADCARQQTSPSPPRCIGDAWSGVRGVMHHSYSTNLIKTILGQAGLPISKVGYTGTFKGPLLDGADLLVSALDDESRDRFVVGCVQEIVALERKKADGAASHEESFESETLQRLRVVLSRYGHDLSGA